MALLKFELKEDHIKLLKHLRWSIKSEHIISKCDDKEEYGDSPFGGDDLVEDMCIILNGRPSDFNPLDDEQLVSEVSDEEKIKLLELFNELPTALDIILCTGSFEPGHYKSKWYDRNWIKYEPKIKLV
jgi:hypothetical protein